LARDSSIAALSKLSAPAQGVFRGHVAVALGVTRNQLTALCRAGRHGYRIVFATWDKVTRPPRRLLDELTATLSAEPRGGPP
jgi:hypothetical protein